MKISTALNHSVSGMLCVSTISTEDQLYSYLLASSTAPPEINIMMRGIFIKGKFCFNPRLMIPAFIIIVLINIFKIHSSLQQGKDIRQVDDAPSTSGSSLSSGVGIVTTDGAWGDSGKHKYNRQDIKILGFTDRKFLPIAKLWYTRLSILVSFLHESVQPSSRPCCLLHKSLQSNRFFHLPF
jgi:hypothetical protein